MNVLNHYELNSLSISSYSLFRERFIPTLTAQQKKIMLIVAGIFFGAVCCLTLITRRWTLNPLDVKENQNIKPCKAITKIKVNSINTEAAKTEESVAKAGIELVKKDMSYEDIQKILDGSSLDYRFNPAHCSKPTIDLEKLPRDCDFDKYLCLFDDIAWETKYNLLKDRLKGNDRFMDFLGEKHPGVDPQTLSKDFGTYIKELSLNDGVSAEEYAAKWMREQLVKLIVVLKKNQVMEGQQDLDKAKQLSEIVLSHLLSLVKQNLEIDNLISKLIVDSKIEIKDPILKLKIANKLELSDDNGDKMEFEEALLKLSHDNLVKLKKALSSLKITNQIVLEDSLLKLAFEEKCIKTIKSTAYELLVGFFEELADPIQEYENKILQALQKQKGHLENAVKEIGELYFSLYLGQIINGNPLLSNDQKETIMEKYCDWNNNQWTFAETLERFHRLLFTRLGVYI